MKATKEVWINKNIITSVALNFLIYLTIVKAPSNVTTKRTLKQNPQKMENVENQTPLPSSQSCFQVSFQRSLYITLSICTLVIVVTLYNEFLNNPTITGLDDSTFPVTDVPFPGISVCSINKISKRKAEKFAELL